MKTKLFALVILLGITGCAGFVAKPDTINVDSTAAKEMLLIGTFHYNNPGADIAKTKSFDILKKKSQLELEEISESIQKFNPTRIFVEWPHDEQDELNSLYQLYLNNTYFEDDSLSDFRRRNEIFQLAFRVAKRNDLKAVYAIDYATSFPFDDVMQDIESSNQTALKTKILDGISKFTVDFDAKIQSKTSLAELTYYLNTPEMRFFSNDFHNNLMLLAGEPTDFAGPLLTSEWYKRNLYMWSLIQKHTQQDDQRVMVLVGASHAAMLDLFIDANTDWRVTELQDVMNQ